MSDFETRLAQAEKEASDLQVQASQAKSRYDDLVKEKRREDIDRLAGAIKTLGITRDELSAAPDLLEAEGWEETNATRSKPGSQTRAKSDAPPKYWNPDNHSELWAGRGGKVPYWAEKYMTSEKGKTPRTFSDAMLNPERVKYDAAKA